MTSKRYTEEFKIEAVRQVVERGHSVAEVASRLGMTTHSLYAWKMKYGPDSAEHQAKAATEIENKRLKKELKRVTEERDLLKKRRCTSPTSPSEVHLYPCAQWQLASAPIMPAVRCASERLLRLVQTAAFSSSNSQSAVDGADQAVLAGKRRRVRLPQDPYRP